MSYYGARGDFYTGRTGYYRAGDPGFFSSIGSIFKKVVPIAASVFGGPVGGMAAGLLSGGGGGSAPQQPSISAAGVASRSAAARLSGAGRTLPGMGLMSRPGMGSLAPRAAPGTPRVAGMRHMSTLQRTGMRKRPSMNVCNPRALRRAIRRAKGFEKLALRSIRLVSPHRLHGKRRGGFKVSRRRK